MRPTWPGRAGRLTLLLVLVGGVQLSQSQWLMGQTAGLDSVPAIVRAAESGDVAAFVNLVSYSTLTCTDSPSGIGAPPLCNEAGLPSGSRVSVFPRAGCETEFVLENVLPRFLTLALASQPTYYGVLQPARFPVDLPKPAAQPSAADYALVFKQQSSAGDLYLALHLAAGRIVAMQSLGICGGQLPDAGDPSWIVPPAA